MRRRATRGAPPVGGRRAALVAPVRVLALTAALLLAAIALPAQGGGCARCGGG